MKYLLITLSLTIFVSGKDINKKTRNHLTKEIEQEILEMKEVLNVPGLSVTIVKDKEIIFCKGFGLSNIDKKIPFSFNKI